jgi:predicted CXXCH cytochrome family protein
VNAEDKCAGCHRAHAGYASLLKMDQYELCTTCHGGLGGGSSNVLTGTNSTGALNGGMFKLVADGGTATSIHTVTGGVTTIPDASNPTLVRSLGCTSCHDPHGMRWDTTGPNAVVTPGGAVEQYRMLKAGPNADPSWNGQVLSNESPKSKNTKNWKSGTSQFCGSCHDMDLAHSNANGEVIRHKVDVSLNSLTTVLPLQRPGGTDTEGQIACMTCHTPHGSAALATSSRSAGVVMPNVTFDTAGNPSYLLRMDNRGVCQDCHKK